MNNQNILTRITDEQNYHLIFLDYLGNNIIDAKFESF